MITHDLLDIYESVEGDYERISMGETVDETDWGSVDGLLLDLHLIKHGYATDGYEKHIERKLKEVCADDGVVERMKAMQL